MKCHQQSQPASQRFWDRHFAAGSSHGAKIAQITGVSRGLPSFFLPLTLIFSLYAITLPWTIGKKSIGSRHTSGTGDDWTKERARRGTRNVKLSWLNTGQIYRTIDAFGPLQPAVVDISLRPRIIPQHRATWSSENVQCSRHSSA